jgi:hypothetical protein
MRTASEPSSYSFRIAPRVARIALGSSLMLLS